MFKSMAVVALVSSAQSIIVRNDPICDTYSGCNTLHYGGEGKDAWPVGYTVPDFGVDSDIIASTQSLSAAESGLSHGTWAPTFKHPEGHPMDYPVPNFGVDTDILSTATSLNVAEAITKHKWNW